VFVPPPVGPDPRLAGGVARAAPPPTVTNKAVTAITAAIRKENIASTLSLTGATIDRSGLGVRTGLGGQETDSPYPKRFNAARLRRGPD